MNQSKKGRVLLLKDFDEEKEIEFELGYLLSLSSAQRFSLMMSKSRELKINLINNGHRKTASIIKRK